MASYPPTALRCLDLAAAAAPGMIDRAIAQAVTLMQEEERQSPNVARRQEVADAWLELLQRRKDWRDRYPGLLRSAQDGPLPQAVAPVRSGRAALSLVDDEALVQTLESSRMKQLLAPRLEQPLAELDGLMSTALGLATVQPERNPLRPDVFAQSLRELMHPGGRPHWAGLWMRHLAQPMAGELETLYRQALELLKAADLTAAPYRVLPPAAVPAATASTAAQPQALQPQALQQAQPQLPAQTLPAHTLPALAGDATAGGSGWADLAPYALGDALFQQFLHARSEPPPQPLAPSFYARVDQQLAAIEAAPADVAFDPQVAVQHRALAPVERPHRAVGTESALDDAVWGRWAPARERSLVRGQLKKQASHVGQVLGLEVVRKLVDQVGRDPRLLAPVREAIVALEPALLRLALAAPRFFGQEEHAGRRLVERVAERSFKYNDEFASEFDAFFDEVRDTFQSLNEAAIEGEQPFAQALQELEASWAAQDAPEGAGRQIAVDALYFAEARDAEAGQIAWSLSQRSDLDGVPAVVQDFLFGPWSLVMAHARLTDSGRGVDPGGWNTVVTELLWSVKREQILREPGRLISTIPGMLERLRGGLALVGQGVAENDNFFSALESLHRPVLQLRARSRKGKAAEAPAVDPALLSTERQQPRRSGEAPWLAPAEREAIGLEETTAPAQDDPLPAAEVAMLLESLHQGAWVDLYARQKWRRANLTWVSSHATLFMFVSSGGRPHSMTRRSLERLLRERLLRPVPQGEVVARALEQLSHAASRPQPLAA